MSWGLRVAGRVGKVGGGGQPAGGHKREPGLKPGEHPRGNGRCGAGNSTPRVENLCDRARVVLEWFWPLRGARRKHLVDA